MPIETADGPRAEDPNSQPDEIIDPDPFTIGLGIFGSIAGGGAFLEARKQRQFMERQQREAFRAAWFAARRSLIFFRQAIDEFETYMLEEGYEQSAFRIGAVRLSVNRGRHQSMRRLKGQALTTANILSDNLDELSEFLGSDYQDAVDQILSTLAQIEFPRSYAELVLEARRGHALFDDLLRDIASREGFESST